MTVQTISVLNLALAFIPVVIVLAIMFSWSLKGWQALYALIRMVVQLLLIGYVLVFIFNADDAWFVGGILAVMIIAASWIALNPIVKRRGEIYPLVFISLLIGCGLTLAVMTQGVLQLDPWFAPNFMIPLAGMIFANSMNTVSLAAERFETELSRGEEISAARRIALQTGLIPVINSLLAVGIVSLPGMMTGQILSGISPLIAVRYQIMVMCMMFGASGISTAIYLLLISRVSARSNVAVKPV